MVTCFNLLIYGDDSGATHANAGKRGVGREKEQREKKKRKGNMMTFVAAHD